MCKNIVEIMLENKLPENTVDMIMKFHKSIPDKISDGLDWIGSPYREIKNVLKMLIIN